MAVCPLWLGAGLGGLPPVCLSTRACMPGGSLGDSTGRLCAAYSVVRLPALVIASEMLV